MSYSPVNNNILRPSPIQIRLERESILRESEPLTPLCDDPPSPGPLVRSPAMDDITLEHQEELNSFELATTPDDMDFMARILFGD